MEQEKKDVTVTEEDLSFLEKELQKSIRPFLLQDLTKKLAYRKSAHRLAQEVKIYNPYSIYEVGDSICKDYDEVLTVSSKGSEHFKGSIVLKVVNKVNYKDFNCEMLEVEYTGGGVFRKYVDYMKKTKTQVLLPSNLEGKALESELMKKDEDPRLTELPMDEKDMRALERSILQSLSKSAKFFNWSEYWQLTGNMVAIPDEKNKEMENLLEQTRQSAETETFIEKLFGISPDDNSFEIHALSLNYTLEKKHKKNFINVVPDGWGKWHLKKVLDSLLVNLPISAPMAKLPQFEKQEEPETAEVNTSSLKAYLTWREILSGGLKTPRSLNRELSRCREYIFLDAETETPYTVYFYPTHDFFLGLKDFYEQNNVPQGASLTMERTGPNQFNFWLKKSKKKLSMMKVEYDHEKDIFNDTGEEIFTFSIPNKIIHLEKETFSRLSPLYPERENRDLEQLLILIFKNFGLVGNYFSLHSQRAFHLVDVIKQTTMEDIEFTLHNTSQFSKSEKRKGMFFFHEVAEVKPEKEEVEKLEIPFEIPEEEVVPTDARISDQEFAPEASFEEELVIEPFPVKRARREEEVTLTETEPPREIPPKKEKAKPPKKFRPEGEKILRARKGDKKIIEEKIEMEEHELEALTAIKEAREEEERRELAAAQKAKEEAKKPLVKEESVFRGIFGDKLKTALDKKDKPKPKK